MTGGFLTPTLPDLAVETFSGRGLPMSAPESSVTGSSGRDEIISMDHLEADLNTNDTI